MAEPPQLRWKLPDSLSPLLPAASECPFPAQESPVLACTLPWTGCLGRERLERG